MESGDMKTFCPLSSIISLLKILKAKSVLEAMRLLSTLLASSSDFSSDTTGTVLMLPLSFAHEEKTGTLTRRSAVIITIPVIVFIFFIFISMPGLNNKYYATNP